MKNIMISTALAAIVASSAAAQDSIFQAVADPQQVVASDFIGMRVYASETALDGDVFDGLQDGWEDIGEINDVILSRDGTMDAVLVDIGGFLGVGERQVAVDMNAIRFVSDSSTADDENDYFLVMSASRAEFEQAQNYDWGKTAMENTEAAVEGVTAEVKEAAASTAAAVDNAAEETVDAMTPTVREGYETAAEEDLTTEMLTGAKAYDANDEWVGEISSLLVDDSGKITHGIVDVGGFLGIGEKPVELPISEIDILRQNGGGDVRVYIAMSKEELEALPVYGQ